MSGEWRDVPGYEGLYQVSSDGRVRSLDRVIIASPGYKKTLKGIVLTPVASPSDKYPAVFVSRGTLASRRHVKVHRLVAEAFLADSYFSGAEVCHNDGNPLNNHVENLRWGTRSDNARDKRIHGTDHGVNKTHCPQGHEYTPENTGPSRRSDGSTSRRCRACHREATQKRRARLRERRTAA